MKLILALSLCIIGCTNAKDGKTGIQGPQGFQGQQGMQGLQGEPGSSCSVNKTESGTVISCQDGTFAVVMDGARGDTGIKGDSGSTGSTGPKGSTGPSGLNGHNSIIKQYTAPSTSCHFGGLLIVSFLDMNDDGNYTEGIDKNYQANVICSNKQD